MEEYIEMKNSVDVSERVEQKIRNVGVKNLDYKTARELGIFERISYLLCAMHQCVTAAYQIYGLVDNTLSMIGGKKAEIKKTCTDFEKSFSRFNSFFIGDKHVIDEKAMIQETDAFFEHIMRYLDIPVEWVAGQPNRTECKTDIAIRIEREEGSDLTFHRCEVYNEPMKEPVEKWCVTMYNERERKQEAIYTDMDKATAIMSAKRSSANDPDNYYTASILIERDERKIDVTPYQVFRENKSVGTIKKMKR